MEAGPANEPTAPSPAPPLAPASAPAAQRIRSIDALRGFDMMMIVGGREVILGLTAAFASERFHAATYKQFEHPDWHGFTPYDLIFPLFLFLAGASLPFSFRAREARGESRRSLALHTIRRAAILVALGVLYNGVLGFRPDLSLRIASVLGRIGLAWAAAALILLFLKSVRLQVVAFFLVLSLHAGLLLFVPMPGLEEVSLDPGQTITDWIDRHITPGRFYMGDRDPEALMGTIPAIGTALLGSFAGRWIGRADLAPTQRAGGLLILGLQCLAAGKLLDVVGLPINKNLWTASFVFWAGGWSVLLLALFHLLFDIWKLPRLALFFSVIGANAILAYIAGTFIDFRDIAEIVFARGFEYKKLHPALLPALALAIQWSLLYVLYRRRIFLRV